MAYRFDIELTRRIRKYENFKIKRGSLLKFILEDETGNQLYCDKCGNFSNFVLFEVHGFRLLRVPICKKHAHELEKEGSFTVEGFTVFKPKETDTINFLIEKYEQGETVNA